MMGARKLGKYPVEGTFILLSPIRRGEHPEKQHFGAASLDLSNHLVEIVINGRRIDAAQRVVGAERQDHQVGLVSQRPIEPRETACRCISGNAGIDDARLAPPLPEPCLEARREGLSRRQPITGGEAVAEIKDHRNVCRRRRGDDCKAQRSCSEDAASGAVPLNPTLSSKVGRGGMSHRVENGTRHAIWSGILPPEAWLGRDMTTSFHSGDTIVVLEDVHLTLESAAGPVNILRGVSLEIGAGETVSIVGPSGSGKSTLMMVLGGLERPSAGRVRIDGHELGALSEDALAQLRCARIGIVFQAFHLIPTMTALENVAVPLELGGRSDAFAAAAEGLGAVGLSHRLTHYPGQLSGGEQQRVAIARAFIAGPKLLLADEPTGNLDDATGRLVIDCLFDHQARHGTTLLLITHDPSIAERCERQVRLMDGRIVEDRRATRAPVGTVRRAL